MTSDSNIKLLAYKPIGSQADLDSKRVTFKLTDYSVLSFRRSVTLVILVMLITCSVFLTLGAGYAVRYGLPVGSQENKVNNSEPVSVIPKDENLTMTERPDSIQDLQTRLVQNTAFNVSQLVSKSGTQSNIESVSPIPRYNISLSQIFKKHNHLMHLIQKHNAKISDNPRVKRSPWFEYHNNTHYISRNYTHEQLIKAPTVES